MSKKTGIYARVSSTGDRQDIERQVAELKKCAVASEMEVVKFFEKKASGAKDDREVLAEYRNSGILAEKRLWKEKIARHSKAVVFDTETSGLDSEKYDILSLSWQVIDLKHGCKTEGKRTCYFDWVSDDRVEEKAIGINGLTRERLAALGTMPRKDGLGLFFAALRDCDLAVAHNAEFDRRFVDTTARREGVDIPEWPAVFDTMKSTTEYCHIGRKKNGSYKWPRLYELARKLKIDDSDIDYHTSDADVELTRRCFAKLAELSKSCHSQTVNSTPMPIKTGTGVQSPESQNERYRLRAKYFELNNFSGIKKDVLEGRLVSIKHGIKFTGFPSGDLVTLNNNNEEIQIIYPGGAKARQASLAKLESNAKVGDVIRLKASSGSCSIWINGERIK